MASTVDGEMTAAVIEGENVEAPPASDRPWPSPAFAWYALLLITLATAMNFFDVAVFGMMGGEA